MIWFKALAKGQKIAAIIILLLILVAIFLFVRDLMTGSAKVEGRLGQNQADAAISSATDAVGTVSGQGEREALRGQDLDKAKDKVNEADDTASAHDAGSSFLCHNLGVCSEE